MIDRENKLFVMRCNFSLKKQRNETKSALFKKACELIQKMLAFRLVLAFLLSIKQSSKLNVGLDTNTFPNYFIKSENGSIKIEISCFFKVMPLLQHFFYGRRKSFGMIHEQDVI
jgi:hypothetical protein